MSGGPSFRRLCLALILFAAPAGVSAQAVSLSVDEMRQLALVLLDEGQPQQAQAVAEALLDRDPGDDVAVFSLAQALLLQGQFVAARRIAAQGFRQGKSDEMRYRIARIAALAAANEGRFTLSQFWLRRALTAAPAPADRQRTMADAQAVRSQNPWRSDVALSFAPSNNVNGGARSAINTVDGLPYALQLSADAQALSGWIGTLDLRTSYRLSETARSRSELGARAYVKAVWLSPEARQALADDNRDLGNGDFGSALVEVSLRHDRVAGQGTLGFGAVLGRSFYAEEANFDFLRLNVDHARPLGSGSVLRLSGYAEQQWDAQDRDDDQRLGASASLEYARPGGDRVSATLSFGAVVSDNVQNTSTTLTLQAGYAFGERIGPAQVSLTVGAQQSLYPDYTVFNPFIFGFVRVPGGRQDDRVFADIDLFFPDYSYAGFAPVVTLSAGATDSNVGRFDQQDLSVNFAIRSVF